jgi:hypothetical protein
MCIKDDMIDCFFTFLNFISVYLPVTNPKFSSPANVLPWQAANAVSTAMLPRSSTVTREAYRVALAGIFSVHRALVWLQSNFNAKTYEKHFAYFRLQCFDDLPTNQLYLYSKADDICLHESIEEFQDKQRERQANIRHVCWHDSGKYSIF